MVFIDTEFNRKNELLSLGFIDANNDLQEFYVKNDPRDKSYLIHGLTRDFLIQNGVEFNNIKPIINSLQSHTIVGFDIEKDLIALNLKPYKLFNQNKIIDLKLIYSFFMNPPSLETIILSTGIFEMHKSKLPIHTSSMDALFLKESFYHLISFLIEQNFDLFEILDDFKEMSSLKYFNEETRTEDLIYSFQKKYKCILEYIDLYDLIKKKIISLDFSRIYYSFSETSISLFDNSEILFAKYKKEINLNLDNFHHIEKNDEYKNIGFKHFNLEEITHGLIR